MINFGILIGGVGRDAEIRKVGENTVAKFSLCTQHADLHNGEWRNKPEWHEVEVWGPGAINAEKYIKKGSTVLVYGSHRTDSMKRGDHYVKFPKLVATGFRVFKEVGQYWPTGAQETPDELKED